MGVRRRPKAAESDVMPAVVPVITPAGVPVGAGAGPRVTTWAEDLAAARAEAPGTADRPERTDRFVRFEPSGGIRYLFGAVFVVASACVALAVLWGVLALAAVAAVLAAGGWWALLASAPALVSIQDGILEVARGPDVDALDLREPDTPLVIEGDTRSRSWRATLMTPSGEVIALTPRDVDPVVFTELVGGYRASGRS